MYDQYIQSSETPRYLALGIWPLFQHEVSLGIKLVQHCISEEAKFAICLRLYPVVQESDTLSPRVQYTPGEISNPWLFQTQAVG